MKGVRLAVLVAAAVVAPVAASSCGDDSLASSTLPPIVTVSTTTTILVPTTTVQKSYIVKRGDTFPVRLADLQAINGIANADDIQAGQELQIPTGAVVFNTLPSPDTTPVGT